MKLIYFITFLLFALTAEGQVLNLKKIELAVQNAADGSYREVFKSSGFELIESTKEGEKGVYEKWMRKDNNLFLTLQHNDSFHFTKLILSTVENTSKPTVRNLLVEISKSYSRKQANNKDYFIKDSNPDTTVYPFNMTNADQEVEGVLFFRKFN